MTPKHVIFLSVANLRPCDIDKSLAPTLHDIANRGAMAELTPSFPCVTSPVQAAMWTGLPASGHGVIANGFYHRDKHEVEMWTSWNEVVGAPQIWDALHAANPPLSSAAWHAQNIKGAAADYIVTPAPIHEDDGTTKLWCYSKPEKLYQEILDSGTPHFPLQHFWGPLSNIESTRWILAGALWLIDRAKPNFHWIYIPHLDYAAQKHGPDSDEAKEALREFDHELGLFVRMVEQRIEDPVYIVAGEYALTDVSGPIHINRALREAGLAVVSEKEGREHLDLVESTAFAMVDHQFAHVFVQSGGSGAIERTADVLRGLDGVADVLVGDDRKKLGIDHSRSGEIVAVSSDDRWFSYYWWLDDAKAPDFARTVDIHQKPGYDPVELFFDPKTKSIPLSAELVKGSHGVPATADRHRTALICSGTTGPVRGGEIYKDTDVRDMTLAALGLL